MLSWYSLLNAQMFERKRLMEFFVGDVKTHTHTHCQSKQKRDQEAGERRNFVQKIILQFN